MTLPTLAYWYEWRASSPLWDRSSDGGMVDLQDLGLSEELIRDIQKTGDWHDTALNWEYPPDPGPWRQEECDRFNKKARELYVRICKELEGRYVVVYEAGEEREDPELDEYLYNPEAFHRKRGVWTSTQHLEWRISRLKRLRILCIFSVPIGLYLGLPLVWILAIIGFIASTIKLEKV